MSEKNGSPIRMAGGELQVPDHPILPFIEGDGTGRDIWRSSQRVFDAAVEKAYGGKRKVDWLQVLAGDASHSKTGVNRTSKPTEAIAAGAVWASPSSARRIPATSPSDSRKTSKTGWS